MHSSGSIKCLKIGSCLACSCSGQQCRALEGAANPAGAVCCGRRALLSATAASVLHADPLRSGAAGVQLQTNQNFEPSRALAMRLGRCAPMGTDLDHRIVYNNNNNDSATAGGGSWADDL